MNNDILNLLNTLELERMVELKKFGSIALIVFAIFLLFFIKFRSNLLPILGLGFFVLIGSYYYLNNNYKSRVENTLLVKLISFIDKDFVYDKDGKVDIELMNSFKLFSHKIENGYSSGVVSIVKGDKSAKISSVVLESVRTDTEEGEHESKRFDGAFAILDLKNSFDQKYLLTSKDMWKDFEVGDELNPLYMGLKPTDISIGKLTLYSQNGKSSLDIGFLTKISTLGENLKVVFDKDIVYIFASGLGSLDVSLFSSLTKQNFFSKYALFLTSLKDKFLDIKSGSL
jgi:hypothetical protein